MCLCVVWLAFLWLHPFYMRSLNWRKYLCIPVILFVCLFVCDHTLGLRSRGLLSPFMRPPPNLPHWPQTYPPEQKLRTTPFGVKHLDKRPVKPLGTNPVRQTHSRSYKTLWTTAHKQVSAGGGIHIDGLLSNLSTFYIFLAKHCEMFEVFSSLATAFCGMMFRSFLPIFCSVVHSSLIVCVIFGACDRLVA